MVKEKRILRAFVLWFITFILLCLYGISNVSAIEYENLGNLIDITVLYASPDYTDSPIELPPNQSLYLQEVRNLTYIVENYNFIANTHYQLESHLKGVTLTNANYYEVTDENGNNCLISYEYSIFYGDYPRWNFQCPYNTKSVAISISNNNNQYLFDPGNFEWSTPLLSKTNTPITSNSSDADNIINNNNQNTQDIINNNNENTDKIIESNKETQEVIKDQFNTCRDSYNLLSSWVNGTVPSISTGLDVKINGESASGYINIDNSKTYTFSFTYAYPSTTSYIFYYNDDNYLGYKVFTSKNYTFTPVDVYDNANKIRFRISNTNVSNIMLNEGSTAKQYEPYGEKICSNKIDETNNQLGDLNNSLNDSNINGSLDSAGSFFDNFSTTDHGGLSGIITAPLVAINQMLNTSCSPMTATFKGKELSLPCGYEFWNRLGAIQDFLNIVLGGMLCYRIIIKLYKLIERIKNPEDDRLEVMDL